MTDIRTITSDQFKSAYYETRDKGKGISPSDELMAIRGLEKGQAVSFPCRWNHKNYTTKGNALPVCMGVSSFGTTLNRKSYRYQWHSPTDDKKKFKFFCNRITAPETDPRLYAMRLDR